MAKKKLLNEAMVRRFMGLAGMKANIVSNTISEMYSYNEEEEDMADEEMPPAEPEMDMEPEMDAEPEMEMEPDAADEPEAAPEAEVEVSQETLDSAEQGLAAIQDLLSTLGGGGEEAPEEPADEPAMDDVIDDVLEETEAATNNALEETDTLEEVELSLSEDEIVQEVARRVAKRILKAKKAKAELDEALGKGK